MSWFTELFKSTAQKQLDAYKPQAIQLVRDMSAKYEAQALTHTNALALQTDLLSAIDKMDINPTLKAPLSLAIVYGVTEANLQGLSKSGETKFIYLRDWIIQKIKDAKLK